MAFINFALNSWTLLPSDCILDCMLYDVCCMFSASSLWSSKLFPWQLLNSWTFSGRGYLRQEGDVELAIMPLFAAGVFYSQITVKRANNKKTSKMWEKHFTHYIRARNFPNRHKLPTKNHFLSKGAICLTTHNGWLRVPPVMLHREGLRWCDFYSVPWR